MQSLTKHFRPENYRLTLDIDQKDHNFSGIVSITGVKKATETKVKLNAVNLEISHVSVSGKPAKFDYDGQIVTIDVGDETSLIIQVKFRGDVSNQMCGIYPCFYQKDGLKQEIIATQFESHYARRAFPCIDEPVAKATFDLTIITEQGKTVLSNMPIAQQISKRSRQLVRFETTPKMSTYTLGFVVGDLVKLEGVTKSGVQVAAYASSAHKPEELSYGLSIAIDALDWYEDYFGIAYPLPKCDHVALPDFASGAMENWGLVTYREALLLVQSDTPLSIRESVASVITHELAHMWFGNLVTMRWWDELWLNESLASIFENRCLAAIRPEIKAEDSFYANSLYSALKRDSIPGVQPVLTPVNTPEEISTMFDGSIVYAKGAYLMHMLEGWVGKEAFRQGLTIFLEKNKYGCPSTQNFTKIFDQLTDKPVSNTLSVWLKTPGFPLLEAQCTGKSTHIKQSQFGYESKNLWPIPIKTPDGYFLLTEKECNFHNDGKIINDEATTYAVTSYDNQDDVLKTLGQSKSPIARYYFLTNQLLLANHNYPDYSQLVKLIASFGDSQDYLTWVGLSRIIYNLKNLIENSAHDLSNLSRLVSSQINPIITNLGLTSKNNEPIDNYRVRSIAIELGIALENSGLTDTLSEQFDDNLSVITPDLRENIIRAKLASDCSPKLIDQLLSAYKETTNPDIRDDLSCALGLTKNHTLIEKLLTLLTDETMIKSQDILSWYAYLVQNTQGRPLAWQWLKQNFTWLTKQFSDNGDYADFVRVSAFCFSTQDLLRDFKKFFAPYENDAILRREIAVGAERISIKTMLIEKNQNSISQEIKNQLSNHSNSSTVKSDLL